MFWKKKALNLCNFFPGRVKIHLTSFSKLEAVRTNGSNLKSGPLFSNMIWQGSPEVEEFPAAEFCKPETIPAWEERLGPFQKKSESQHSFFLHWPMQLDTVLCCVHIVNSHAFCIIGGITQLSQLKRDTSLSAVHSTVWEPGRGKQLLLECPHFPEIVSCCCKVCQACTAQENPTYLLLPFLLMITQPLLWQERNETGNIFISK